MKTNSFVDVQAEVLVDRELKKLNEARIASSKIKRQLHAASRDLEKVEQQAEVEKTDSPKVGFK